MSKHHKKKKSLKPPQNNSKKITQTKTIKSFNPKKSSKEKHLQSADSVFQGLYQEDDLPGRIEKNYQLVSCLKYSDEACVYRIQSRASGQQYILKCCQGAYSDRVLREYDMLCRLQGYGVPKAMECFTEQNVVYLIREYIKGRTIEERVEKQGVYKKADAIHAMLSICDTVEQMHRSDPPIVHRDIKPQNMIEREDGGYCLIDLDTAREYKMDSNYDTIYVGTRITAAPEQFGYTQTSIRSDIYSLGVLFLYMLTGDYTTRCQEWQELPREYRGVINQCLAFDPKNRYGSVQSLMRELRCLLHTSRRRRTLAVQLAAILLCAGVGIGSGIHLYSGYRYEHENYHFSNAQIEEAVRSSLGIERDVPIHEADLQQVTTLILCGDQVFTSWEAHQEYHDTYWTEFNNMPRQTIAQELSDLDKMANLKTLVLDNQGLNDLDVLKGHDTLSRLSIQKNQLETLEGIEACPHLRTLTVIDNPITEAEALDPLEELQVLRISTTHIHSLDVLRGKPITYLDTTDNPPIDYDFLDDLESLERLMIGKADSEMIAKINQRSNLRMVGLFESDLEDLHELADLTKLDNLDITASEKCRNIAGIRNYPYLNYLCISYTSVEDISEIRELSELEFLDITNAPIQDLSPIQDCDSLRYIFLDSGKEAAVRQLDLREDIEIIVNE